MLAVVGMLAGCGGSATPEAEPTEEVPIVTDDSDGTVVAEAVIEPARWGELGFEVSGDVAEVFLQEGEAALAGDPLVSLVTDDLQRTVTQAELDLRQAELRLEELQEAADDSDVLLAQGAVTRAAASLDVAELNVSTVVSSTLLNESLEDAQSAFDQAEGYYIRRQEEYERGEVTYWYVEQAEEAYEDAQLALARVRQQGTLELENAQSELDQARQAYQEAVDELNDLLDGADAQELEQAQLDVESARLTLEEARTNLEEAILRAPFDAIVTKVNVDIGDAVAAGEVVVVIATLDDLKARTVDLTELDVARLREGQQAIVTTDALPDVQLNGHVERIDLQSVEYRGDVTYPVTVGLDEAVPELRWGMTAVVEIETE
jgi:HlyD family secretion protein